MINMKNRQKQSALLFAGKDYFSSLYRIAMTSYGHKIEEQVKLEIKRALEADRGIKKDSVY